MKVSDYVIDFVAESGAKHLFLLPGGGCMHLVDSAGRSGKLELIPCLHEQACAFAAECYAEVSNGIGAVLVTSGPGGTNAVTGVAAAWMESASCLFISGQVKRADMIGTRSVRSMGPQEIDIVSIVSPITKYAATVLDPETIRYHLEKAVYLAMHGRRGPVWIDVPLDVQAATVDETRLAPFQIADAIVDSALLDRQAAEAIALLNRAERPVLLLGNGARAIAERGLLEAFVGALGIPVLTTWKGIDLLPDNHSLFAGRPGSVAERGANFTQQNCDCLLIVGARLDLPQTAFDHENFARYAKKIMIDVDEAEIRKMQTQIHVPVCADSVSFAEAFLRQSRKFGTREHHAWVDRCREWRRTYPVIGPEQRQPFQSAVNYYAFIDVLSDVLRESDLIVPGSSGPCSDILMQAFRVKAGQRIVNAPGLGAMGTGLPAAIGACLASGRKRTVCVNGDGGFQLNIQELETVRRLDLPVKFFVICNGGYASIMAMQKNHFGGRLVASDPSSGLTLPDVVRLAQAYDLDTDRICDHSHMRKRIESVLAKEGPVACAVSASPDQLPQPRAASRVLSDGSIISARMEDMWPFLDRDEFLSNMLVPSAESRE